MKFLQKRRLLLALAALLPLAALAVGLAALFLWQQQSAMRSEAIHHASGILETVENELEAQLEVLKVLARAPEINQSIPDLAAFHGVASRYKQELSRWDKIILADLEGRQIVNSGVPFGTTLPLVSDPQGHRRAIETAAPVVGNLTGPGSLSSDGRPRVSIRVPVLQGGKVRYTLTALISPERLSKLITQGLDPRWRPFMVDEKNYIVAAPRLPEIVGQRPSRQTVEARAAVAEGIYEGMTPSGIRTVTAFRKSGVTGWSAHVAIPLPVYREPLIQAGWILGATVLSALALTGTFLWLLRREEMVREHTAALLSATLKNMEQGLLLVDPDQRVLLYNHRVLDLLDLPAELLERRPLFEEIRQHQARSGEYARVPEEIANLVNTEGFHPGPRIYERERPNGAVLEIRTVPLLDGGAVRTYTDITVQKKAETELRQSEERYRALVNASASFVWRASPEGSMIDGSGWGEYTRYRGDQWVEMIHPDDRERMLSEWMAIVASRAPGEQYCRARRLHGEYRWCVARSAPVMSPDGSIREWVGTLTDIHEQKLAQEKLAGSEARYRLLAENATDMISRVSLDGVRLYISPASREILGYEPEELIGTHLHSMTHPDDAGIVQSGIQNLLSSPDGQQTITYRVRHKDGRWITLESHRRLVRDGNEEPIEFVSVARDVTERQELEERLRQAQKMEAVGQLTGGVAHDFNNLLTIILGNAEILADEIDDPKLGPLAEMIEEAAERGSKLTQQLLAFGRRQSLRPEALKLDEVVHGMVPLLRRTIGEHIDLTTKFSGSRTPTIADRAVLESAILNLAVNARDAMPHGGTLTLETEDVLSQPDRAPEYVSVTISDTGIGMSPQVLERVFEPFFTTKEAGKGTGLGLSMVYGFVSQSGGRVSIKSRPGEGTAVTIILPAADVDVQLLDAASPAAAAPIKGKERVLVVEDEPHVLQFVSSQLISLGYQVTAVPTGLDALEALAQDNSFDLLFTDVVLPKGLSGVELAKQARAFKPDLRVLLTSGYPEEVFESNGRPDADTLLLPKPFRRKKLAAVLRKALEPTASSAFSLC